MPDLYSDEGTLIPELKLTSRTVVNRTLALYGPSKSGKTVITKHVLDLIRPEVEQVLLVSPTEPSNQSFKNYISRPLIHYGMTAPDPKNPHKRIGGAAGAMAFLEGVWQRQEMLTQIYKRANEHKTLKKLFGRLSQKGKSACLADIAGAEKIRSKAEERLKKKFRNDASRLAEEQEKVTTSFETMKGQIYKKYVWKEIGHVWKQPLSEDERWAVAYIELNPRMVLIFDDCAAELKPLFNKPIFRKLFYQNRHNFLTVIFTLQDDTDLPTNLRKNAFISIFCNEVVCKSNFERATNKYPKATQKHVQEIAPVIYKSRFRKLAYVRDDPRGKEFYHFQAPRLENKMFGSEALRELCHALESNASAVDSKNPFYDQFKF